MFTEPLRLQESEFPQSYQGEEEVTEPGEGRRLLDISEEVALPSWMQQRDYSVAWHSTSGQRGCFTFWTPANGAHSVQLSQWMASQSR